MADYGGAWPMADYHRWVAAQVPKTRGRQVDIREDSNIDAF
jgi:hypothetical protein